MGKMLHNAWQKAVAERRRTNNTYHAAGIELRYLPPYSPDMNPIEMLWSKVKALCANGSAGLPNSCLKPSPVRFCASVNGIASAGLKLMDNAHNFGNCYR